MNIQEKTFPFSPREFLLRLEKAAKGNFPEFYCGFENVCGRLGAKVFWDEAELLPTSFYFNHPDWTGFCVGEEDRRDVQQIHVFAARLGKKREPILSHEQIQTIFGLLGPMGDLEEILSDLRTLPEGPGPRSITIMIQEKNLVYDIYTSTGEAEGIPYYGENIVVESASLPDEKLWPTFSQLPEKMWCEDSSTALTLRSE